MSSFSCTNMVNIFLHFNFFSASLLSAIDIEIDWNFPIYLCIAKKKKNVTTPNRKFEKLDYVRKVFLAQ